MVLLTDRDGRVLAACEIHSGLVAVDILSRPVWSLTTQIDSDRLKTSLMDALEFGEPQRCTVRCAQTFDSWHVVVHPVLHVPGDVKLVLRFKHIPEAVFALSGKQRHILKRMAAGFSVRAVATDVGVSENTVRTQLLRAKVKTGCPNMLNLVLLAKEYLQ
jgi:DNA-binding CsgD family transcriptional regulator